MIRIHTEKVIDPFFFILYWDAASEDLEKTIRQGYNTVWKPCLQDFSKHERIIPPLDGVLF